MCGIVAFYDPKINEKQAVIGKMMAAIKHRGPNSDGYYTNDEVALGFRRLSIIDLRGGSQPIYNEDKTRAIIFNGEIYNFKPLREELIKAGHVFSTKADTEVLLHGYEEWGMGHEDDLFVGRISQNFDNFLNLIFTHSQYNLIVIALLPAVI